MSELASLWDIEEVARQLRVTERFVRRLVAERRIPYVKVGRFVRFDPADIAAWLSAARVPARVGVAPLLYHRGGAQYAVVACWRLRIAPLRRLVTSTGTGAER